MKQSNDLPKLPDGRMFARIGPLAGRALAVVAVAAAATGFVALLPVLGHNIRQPQIEQDYLRGLLFASAIGVSILIWPVRDEDKLTLLALWMVKCAVTLGLMLVYEWHYPLDAYDYFNMATDHILPTAAGGAVVVRVAEVFVRAVPSSYHALKVGFSAIGLICIYLFYRAAVLAIGREDRRLLLLLGLFPSILFWSSIVGKDPLQLFGIAIYVYGVVAWYRTTGWLYLALAAVGIVFSVALRVWSGPIMIIPLLPLAFRRGGHPLRKIVLIALIVAGGAKAWSVFAERFQVEGAEDLIAATQDVSRGWDGGGSSLQNANGFTDFKSMIVYAPLGVFTSLFRPLPGEVRNLFGLLSGAETTVLLVLLIRVFMNSKRKRFADPLILWAIVLVLTWAVFYGFTAFNLGAVVRFKLQILPVLLLLLLYLGQRDEETLPAVAGAV